MKCDLNCDNCKLPVEKCKGGKKGAPSPKAVKYYSPIGSTRRKQLKGTGVATNGANGFRKNNKYF